MEEIKSILQQAQVPSFEVIPLLQPLSLHKYTDWLDKGQQAEMDYMAKSVEVRSMPAKHFAPMQSLIMFTEPYYPHPEPIQDLYPSLKIAHYARNKDYHHWFRDKLKGLINLLKERFPDESFMAFTDAVPLLERDHAAQAALGWVGKNTCLIHPKQGSLFFIGEILTSLPCDQSFLPMHDFCGSCTACIDACPTDALNDQRVLDANLCLSHWNIESREVPPIEIREKMQAWFFGCDICQTVCPWNMKLFKERNDFEQQSGDRASLTCELQSILESSNKQLLKLVKDTPLSRAGGRGLKRNALIVIANLKIHELKPQVKNFIQHEKLGELALWTLEQLKAGHTEKPPL